MNTHHLERKASFTCVIRAKIWPTSTPKRAKSIIVGCNIKETLSESLKVNDFARE
jgi:hypothetical protein